MCDNWEAIEECVQRDSGFGSRQRRAETVVDTHAKGNMVAQVTIQAKFIGIQERARVTVGRPVENCDPVTLSDFDARDLDITRCRAEQALNWAFVAQGLFDHGFDQAAIPAQLLP